MGPTKILNLNELCKSIINIDRNVRSVIIIDKEGKVLHTVIRRGFSQPNFERWNDTHFMECVLEISLGRKFDDLYGPIQYHHSEKDNFIMFSFPFHQTIILLTSTKNIAPISLATKISCFINDKTIEL